MRKIKTNKKISIFSIQDRDLFTTLSTSYCKYVCKKYIFGEKDLYSDRRLFLAEARQNVSTYRSAKPSPISYLSDGGPLRVD